MRAHVVENARAHSHKIFRQIVMRQKNLFKEDKTAAKIHSIRSGYNCQVESLIVSTYMILMQLEICLCDLIFAGIVLNVNNLRHKSLHS